MQELLDVAMLLSGTPIPSGGRVAIVTNGRGPGILCADACQASELTVPEWSDAIRRRLGEVLPPEALLGNPINLRAGASAEQYRRTIEVLAREDGCDAVIVIFAATPGTQADDVVRAVVGASESAEALTVAAVVVGAQPSARGASRVPVFAFPEEAVRALAHAVRYADWRLRPAGGVPAFADVRRDEAAAIIARALSDGQEWLAPQTVADVFDCYGLALIPTRVVRGIAGAVRAAAEFGGPVALKALVPGLRHKADAGAVRLGLIGPTAVRRAARQIKAAVAAAGRRLHGFVVQPMAHPGVEIVMGIVHDQSFGPVVVCGAGGTGSGPLMEVSVRITPLADLDADKMLGALRTVAALESPAGGPRCDIDTLKDTLLRLSALAQTHAEIAELDVAPVIVAPGGAAIVDARIRLAPGAPRLPLAALHG